MPIVPADSLERTVAAVFAACKTPPEEAQIVAAHLVDAEACGVVSHGLLRVPQYVEALAAGRIVPDARLRVVSETPATLVLDGQRGFGQVMALRAMEMAVERAEATGASTVSLANCSHTGRLGFYTEHAARRGMAAMMMVNSGGCGQWVAPFGGISGRLATNPLSIAVPSEGDDPIVLDIATSVAPEGKVRAAQTAGRMLPPGWVVDHRGQPASDPAALYGPPTGALLPFGGHKGFGLAMLVDALAGGLSGAGCCTDAGAPKAGETDGVFIVVVKIAAFQGLSDFRQNMGRLTRHVKSSPPSEAGVEVLVPGELEAKTRRRRLLEGIPVEPATWAACCGSN
ncbi:MAG TPA: Ldh family oxidoreductase [Pirellulales bacterium]|nr:Ldh family oxidoreductase [Pirellulales bacterium]